MKIIYFFIILILITGKNSEANKFNCNFPYQGQEIHANEIEDGKFEYILNNVLLESESKELKDSIRSCENAISQGLERYKDLLKRFYSVKSSIQTNADIETLKSRAEELERGKVEIVKTAEANLAKITMKGLYAAVVEAPINESKAKLISRARALIAPKAISDIRGIVINSLQKYENRQKVMDFINNKTYGRMEVEKSLHEYRFFSSSKSYLFYIVEVVVYPLDIEKFGHVPLDPNVVGFASSVETRKELNNFYTFTEKIGSQVSTNIKREVSSSSLGTYSAWRKNISSYNKNSKTMEAQVLSEILKKLTGKDIEIAKVNRQILNKRNLLNTLYTSIKYECSNSYSPEICMESVLGKIDVKISNIVRIMLELKNSKPSLRIGSVRGEGFPEEEIKLMVKDFYNNFKTTYGSTIDLYKEIDIEDNRVVSSSLNIKLKVNREPTKVVVYPYNEGDGLKVLMTVFFILSEDDLSFDVATEFDDSRSLKHKSIDSVIISPDSGTIVTVGEMGVARGWSARSGKLLFETTGHMSGGATSGFSPDGEVFFTEASDRVVTVWSALDGSKIYSIDSAWKSMFSPDGRFLVTFRNGAIRFVDQGSGKHIKDIYIGSITSSNKNSDDISVTDMAFNPRENTLAVATMKNLIILDIEKETVQKMKLPAQQVSYSNDGYAFWVVYKDTNGLEKLKVYDNHGGKIIKFSPEGYFKTGKFSAKFSSNSRNILFTDYNSTATIWDLTKPGGKWKLSLDRYHTDRLFQAIYSSNSSFVLTSSYDYTVKLWDPSDGKMIASIDDHINDPSRGVKLPVQAVISPNSRYIVTACLEGDYAKIWDLSTLKKGE